MGLTIIPSYNKELLVYFCSFCKTQSFEDRKSELPVFQLIHEAVTDAVRRGVSKKDIDLILESTANKADVAGHKDLIIAIAEVQECLHGYAYPEIP